MKKYLLIAFVGLIGLGILTVVEYQQTADGKLHIVICDVGQGDGILITSPSGKRILYDSGPDNSILSCLSDNMPFWQKTIDLFILSHPHADHFMGMFSVFPNYTVKSYASETLANRSIGFKEFEKQLQVHDLKKQRVTKGNTIDLGDGVVLAILGPSESFLTSTSPQGTIGESGEFASVVMLVTYGSFRALLTGDSQVSGLLDANPPDVTLLHVPHHGSAYGLDVQIVEKIDPEIAVISVGENSYGHPSKEILQILGDEDIKVYRTDQLGSLHVSTDGQSYDIQAQH